MSSNDKTIKAYDASVQEYIQNTPYEYLPYHVHMLRWIDTALGLIPQNGSVLEFGSATPRDARHIRSRGYSVQTSDATPGFIKYLHSQGENAIKINLLQDDISSEYDMYLAVAVMPHLSHDEVKIVLEKLYKTMKSGSIFAFNTKQGNGEEWIFEKITQPRYTSYWQPEEIKAFVEKIGFKIRFLEYGSRGDTPAAFWTSLIAQK